MSEIDLRGLRVLMVDDQPDARELVKRVLTQYAADVMLAGSASEALEQLKAAKPDVIVSDIGLPENDGYQLLREVRSLSPAEGGRTPAVALTAFARSEDRMQAIMAGYQMHMTKPVGPRELVAIIAAIAGRVGPMTR